MQNLDFEPIYEALRLRLASLEGVKTVSRRMQHWTAVAPADHPAIFTAQVSEAPENVKGQPPRWRLKVDVYVYVHVGNSTKAVPATALNTILRDVRGLFVVNPVTGVPEGFNGLCSHVWIAGEVELFDGVLGAQAVAVIPVEVLTA